MSLVEQEQVAPMADAGVRDRLPDPIVRPAPHRWLWYAFGGGLPARHRGWVLFDTTTRTWWLRHLLRMLVQLAVPIALLLAFLPAGWGLRLACAGGGLALATALGSRPGERGVRRCGTPHGDRACDAGRRARWRSRRSRAAAPA